MIYENNFFFISNPVFQENHAKELAKTATTNGHKSPDPGEEDEEEEEEEEEQTRMLRSPDARETMGTNKNVVRDGFFL